MDDILENLKIQARNRDYSVSVGDGFIEIFRPDREVTEKNIKQILPWGTKNKVLMEVITGARFNYIRVSMK